jgi:membrane fusion protein (multidrug efflux system)
VDRVSAEVSATCRNDDHGYGHDMIGDELIPDGGSAAAVNAAVINTQRRWTGRARLRAWLLLGGLAVLLLGALLVWLGGGRYESTDNAAIQAGQVAIAANVSGQVVAIAVHENQAVSAGEILFRIDPRPYQAAIDEAVARLADARAQIRARRADVREGEAGIEAARAKLAYAVGEAARQKQLLAEGISSQNQYEQAVLALQTARQAVATSEQSTESSRATLTGDGSDIAPTVQAAQAVLDRARLNLAYATVRAPQDGVVTRVDQLQLGSYVAAARPVFTLVGRRIWVAANFKENQLRYMRIGQRATVKVDAFPDVAITARVASFSPGTGSSFALLPAENATGNWVKVVQRLPVRLDLDRVPAGLPLQAGLSADVEVDTGHVRRLFGSETPPETSPETPAAR